MRSFRYLLRGEIRFPTDRLGYVLEQPNGARFFAYRETVRRSTGADSSGDPVVLVFSMQVAHPEVGRAVWEILSAPLANVATPFFAGMPGFRRKLWLAGDRPGSFLELYEWASAADADRFVALLRSLLDPLDFAGDASFDVVPDDSIDEYVANRSVEWHDATSRRRWREPRHRTVVVAVLAFVVCVTGYLVWRYAVQPIRALARAGRE